LNVADEHLNVGVVDVSEVMQAAGISSRTTLDTWIKSGKFPQPLQVVAGGRRKWSRAVVMAWIAANTRDKTGDGK
jgi:predicted DNA-binding transcriptional regulator AlpA